MKVINKEAAARSKRKILFAAVFYKSYFNSFL